MCIVGSNPLKPSGVVGSTWRALGTQTPNFTYVSVQPEVVMVPCSSLLCDWFPSIGVFARGQPFTAVKHKLGMYSNPL